MSMPARRSESENVQFTITLSKADAERLESLIGKPGRSSTRATVAADIIRIELMRLHETGVIKE
jgi:hypothetical protein